MNTYLFILPLVLTIISYTLTTLGAPFFNSLVFRLATLLPTPFASAYTSHRKTQREVLQLRAELRATSSQDEFAKWAKLKRREDKLLVELDEKNKTLAAARAKTQGLSSILQKLLTTGLKVIVQFYYLRQPVFYLPRDAFPPYVEWFLALPKCPTGSVSVQMWFWACAAAVEAVGATVAYLLKKAMAGKKTERVLVGVGAGGEKKEL